MLLRIIRTDRTHKIKAKEASIIPLSDKRTGPSISFAFRKMQIADASNTSPIRKFSSEIFIAIVLLFKINRLMNTC